MAHSASPALDTRPAGKPRWLNLARLADRLTRLLCKASALSIIVLTILLVITLLWHAWLSIQTNGSAFFTGSTWDPEESHRVFGSLAFVYGTLASSALAMLIAVPLGIGTAAFLS